MNRFKVENTSPDEIYYVREKYDGTKPQPHKLAANTAETIEFDGNEAIVFVDRDHPALIDLLAPKSEQAGPVDPNAPVEPPAPPATFGVDLARNVDDSAAIAPPPPGAMLSTDPQPVGVDVAGKVDIGTPNDAAAEQVEARDARLAGQEPIKQQ